MRHSRFLVLALAVTTGGCGPGRNYDQTGVYGTAIHSVLVTRGLCKDEQDCIRKEMVFAEGGTFKSSPVHVNVYNVAAPATAEAIVDAAKSARSSAKVGLELRITASRHLDTPYQHVRRVTIE